jgi:3-methyladenine DNA glycosylase/8-oxoguanine DNA glycosylase
MRTGGTGSIVVSALRASTNFGRLLRRVEDDYVRLAAPEPEVLKVIGEESRRKGTDTLSSRRIDQIIKTARVKKRKRG